MGCTWNVQEAMRKHYKFRNGHVLNLYYSSPLCEFLTSYYDSAMVTSIYIAALLLYQCCVWTGVFVSYGDDKRLPRHCALDNKRSHAVREPDSFAGATRFRFFLGITPLITLGTFLMENFTSCAQTAFHLETLWLATRARMKLR